MPVDGSAPATVVTGAAPEGGGLEGDAQGDHGSPAWSPDSTRLAFSGGLEPDFDLDQRAGIYVAEVGAGIPVELPTITPSPAARSPTAAWPGRPTAAASPPSRSGSSTRRGTAAWP